MGWITEKAVIGQKGGVISFDALDNYICAMQHACSGVAWFFRALQIFCLFPCLFLPFFFPFSRFPFSLTLILKSLLSGLKSTVLEFRQLRRIAPAGQ